MAAPRGAQFAIAPVIGPPENVSTDLRNQLVADLERQNIRVAKSPDEKAEYTLRGYVVSSLEKGSKSKVSYIWDVTDASGKGVHRVSGEETAPSGKSKDPWTAVTPNIVQSIASKTVTSVAGWMPGAGPVVASATQGGYVQTAAASPSSPAYQAPKSPMVTGSVGRGGPVKALVPVVTGAPGDGSSSLRAALQRELTRSGVTLTDAQTGGDTYIVEGKVAMGAGKDGKQPITIDWSVTDPTGKKLGTVSQKNEVPQGSLDGSWGKTADAAAAAAAQGIVKLLPQPTQRTSSN